MSTNTYFILESDVFFEKYSRSIFAPLDIYSAKYISIPPQQEGGKALCPRILLIMRCVGFHLEKDLKNPLKSQKIEKEQLI